VHEVLAAIIGVPATLLIAGGLGVVGVTVYSRVVGRQGREPIRWEHLVLGLLLFAVGTLLIGLEVLVVGV
jgi:hypothetical protein